MVVVVWCMWGGPSVRRRRRRRRKKTPKNLRTCARRSGLGVWGLGKKKGDPRKGKKTKCPRERVLPKWCAPPTPPTKDRLSPPAALIAPAPAHPPETHSLTQEPPVIRHPPLFPHRPPPFPNDQYKDDEHPRAHAHHAQHAQQMKKAKTQTLHDSGVCWGIVWSTHHSPIIRTDAVSMAKSTPS